MQTHRAHRIPAAGSRGAQRCKERQRGQPLVRSVVRRDAKHLGAVSAAIATTDALEERLPATDHPVENNKIHVPDVDPQLQSTGRHTDSACPSGELFLSTLPVLPANRRVVDEDSSFEGIGPLHLLRQPVGHPARVDKDEDLTVFPMAHAIDQGGKVSLGSLDPHCSFDRSPRISLDDREATVLDGWSEEPPQTPWRGDRRGQTDHLDRRAATSLEPADQDPELEPALRVVEEVGFVDHHGLHLFEGGRAPAHEHVERFRRDDEHLCTVRLRRTGSIAMTETHRDPESFQRWLDSAHHVVSQRLGRNDVNDGRLNVPAVGQEMSLNQRCQDSRGLPRTRTSEDQAV